jgi:hypothetical protein
MPKLCAPAIIYLIFSLTQILIDTYKHLYNTAIMKVIVTVMVTLLLNILCDQGLGVVSWIIVFIPFILMTVIVSMLLYIFGLDVATGKFDYNNNKDVTTDALGNIIVYDPEYDPVKHPVYYTSPNIIVPNPHANDNKVKPSQSKPASDYNPFPYGSSSPAYQS